jgi:hypothetical protein
VLSVPLQATLAALRRTKLVVSFPLLAKSPTTSAERTTSSASTTTRLRAPTLRYVVFPVHLRGIILNATAERQLLRRLERLPAGPHSGRSDRERRRQRWRWRWFLVVRCGPSPSCVNGGAPSSSTDVDGSTAAAASYIHHEHSADDVFFVFFLLQVAQEDFDLNHRAAVKHFEHRRC